MCIVLAFVGNNLGGGGGGSVNFMAVDWANVGRKSR